MCQHHKRQGTRLEEGDLHTADHKKWSRRDFLTKASFLTGASIFLSQLPIHAIAKNPLLDLNSSNDNILVLIQLKGGNDGLNTIIPYYDFGYYKSQRSKIHIPKNKSIQLNNDFGMHEALQPLKSLWDKGMMNVINNVGYPEPNMSHFRSKDIWTSSSDSNKMEGTGWLGRYIDSLNVHSSTNGIPPAIEIGGETNLIFQGDNGHRSINVENPKELYETSLSGESFSLLGVNSKYNKELDFLRTACNNTKKYAKSINDADRKSKVQAKYEPDGLSKQLKQVAKLIKGNLGSRIYMVTLDGFDTHAYQAWKHQNLLQGLSRAIHSFYTDLSVSKLQDKVLTMTFSEFGRRIEENGSRGTDHGTSAPILMFGGGLGKSKILGDAADLRNPNQDGNLKHSIDFRQVYASVLQNWMGANELSTHKILKGKFSTVSGLLV